MSSFVLPYEKGVVERFEAIHKGEPFLSVNAVSPTAGKVLQQSTVEGFPLKRKDSDGLGLAVPLTYSLVAAVSLILIPQPACFSV